MRPGQLQKLVKSIRALAVSDSFVVLRENKAVEWKNQLLRHLSDSVVKNHLMCLQPFQYFGSNPCAGIHEFKTNLYSDNIYLKVNIKTLEVVSFHYNELPPSDVMSAHIAKGIEDTSELQVVAEPFTAGGYQASFAVGSSAIVVEIYPETHDGAQWIDAEQYTDALENMAKGKQRTALRKLEAFDKQQIQALMGPVKDYGILSYTEGQLQVISVCYDLWRKNPSERWLQDMALDLILKQNEQVQRKFASQLHRDMPTLLRWMMEHAKEWNNTTEYKISAIQNKRSVDAKEHTEQFPQMAADKHLSQLKKDLSAKSKEMDNFNFVGKS